MFAADTLTELEEWMQTIKEVVKEDRMRMRRKKTQSLVVNRPLANAQEEEEERTLENSLYESSGVSASGEKDLPANKLKPHSKMLLELIVMGYSSPSLIPRTPPPPLQPSMEWGLGSRLQLILHDIVLSIVKHMQQKSCVIGLV